MTHCEYEEFKKRVRRGRITRQIHALKLVWEQPDHRVPMIRMWRGEPGPVFGYRLDRGDGRIYRWYIERATWERLLDKDWLEIYEDEALTPHLQVAPSGEFELETEGWITHAERVLRVVPDE